MKPFLLGLLWRIGIGLGIAVIGIVVSVVTNNWHIDYWWFGGFGALMNSLAAIPQMGGNLSNVRMAWYKPDAYLDDYKRSRSAGSMNWMVTAFIIGIINLLTPILVYHVISSWG